MTLMELITASLIQLDRGTDAQTVEQWRDKLTRYLNDAMIDLCARVQPIAREELPIAGSDVDTSLLTRNCVRVLLVTVGGSVVPFWHWAGTGKIRLSQVKSGTAWLTYRYLPAKLTVDTDVPDLPNSYHSVLASYAVAREQAMGDSASVSAAKAGFDAFMEARRRMWREASVLDPGVLKNV